MGKIIRQELIKDNVRVLNKRKHLLSYADNTFLSRMINKVANKELDGVSVEDYNRLHTLATKYRN